MGLFSRDPLKPRKPFNLTTFLILSVITLIFVQAFGLLFGDALGIDINFGPVFILVAVAGATLLTIAIAKKMLSNMEMSKKDAFAVIVVWAMVVVMMLFFRDYMPELFKPGLASMYNSVQAFISIP